MSTLDPSWEQFHTELLAEIDRSRGGRTTIDIPTLMNWFGFSATRRVHQSSLAWALETLTAMGIAYHYTGTTAHDHITLSRATPSDQQAPPVATGATPAPVELQLEIATPLATLFRFDGMLGERQAQQIALDLHAAVWAFRPVCLFVEAGDEFFAFVCGYLAALLRRRALMMRNAPFGGIPPLAPDLLTIDGLKRVLGRLSDSETQASPFPVPGAVYILRQNIDDVEDDELVAAIREYFIPHTYELQARFASTSGSPTQGERARDSAAFSQIFQWIAAFGGTLHVSPPTPEQPIDLARLLAEAAQLQDNLLERQTLQSVDAAFRAGFESTEHMALKSVLLNGLRRRFPDETIAVEELVALPNEEMVIDELQTDRPRRDRPDLKLGNRLWVEVETLRGLSLRGSNPFFELEAKLRPKLNGMQSVQEVWLIVPSDIAMLARIQFGALTDHLNAALGQPKIKLGFVDLVSETPVLLTNALPVPQEPPRLRGVSLRREATITTQSLSWSDVAGYTAVRERLHADVLDPLLRPDHYQRYGLVAANGLLLYGLPGCGKSLIGRVLAGEAGMSCRFLAPSDLSARWLGWGVAKIRELFDWAVKQAPCLLVLDELDGVAPQRQEANMHTDEKRQVNELLAQLDRIVGKNVIVVATTNYLHGIDNAIRRSGRFDVKIPIFPPTEADRQAIFDYYLTPPRLDQIAGIADLKTRQLAAETPLFVPADIKTVVQTAARHSIRRVDGQAQPVLTMDDVRAAIARHPRSIQREVAIAWADEAEADLGASDPHIGWLRTEIVRAFGIQ